MYKSLLFSVVLMLASCATVGTKIAPDQLSKIQKGSTRADVITALGKTQTVTVVDGKETLVYIHSKVKSSAQNFIPVVGAFSSVNNIDMQQIMIVIDDKGIVENVVSNDSGYQVKSGLIQ